MQHDNLASVSLTHFSQARGWQAQYRLIIQWGTLVSLKPELRQAQYLIKGCETSAWLAHDIHHDVNRFLFDSDSRVINGLAALLLSMIDNKTTQELELLNVKAMLLDLGLEKHITPSRSNGLMAIISRAYALAGCINLQ